MPSPNPSPIRSRFAEEPLFPCPHARTRMSSSSVSQCLLPASQRTENEFEYFRHTRIVSRFEAAEPPPRPLSKSTSASAMSLAPLQQARCALLAATKAAPQALTIWPPPSKSTSVEAASAGEGDESKSARTWRLRTDGRGRKPREGQGRGETRRGDHTPRRHVFAWRHV